MILLASAAAVAGAAAMAAGWWRRRKAGVAINVESSTEQNPLRGLPLQVNDVLLTAEGDELWLSSAAIFSESSPSFVIFFAPLGAGVHWVVLDATRATPVLSRLRPIEVGEFAIEPPHTIEVAGAFYERKRRLPLRVELFGEVPLNLGKQILFVEYRSASESLTVLVDGRTIFAARGEELREGTFDRLPAARSD